ncbi:MAG: CvpA family protein, partial [Pirellulaceae bacterium]|nr:CvpA family protein [Pirellulaceae bacterium]
MFLDPDPDSPAMATYDLIMLAIATLATLFGAWKGLAWQIAWVSATSSLVALELRTSVSSQLGMVGPLGGYVAMGLVFVSVSVIIWLLYRIGYSWIKRSGLGKFDRRLGAAAGILSGLLLCVLITVIS